MFALEWGNFKRAGWWLTLCRQRSIKASLSWFWWYSAIWQHSPINILCNHNKNKKGCGAFFCPPPHPLSHPPTTPTAFVFFFSQHSFLGKCWHSYFNRICHNHTQVADRLHVLAWTVILFTFTSLLSFRTWKFTQRKFHGLSERIILLYIPT